MTTLPTRKQLLEDILIEAQDDTKEGDIMPTAPNHRKVYEGFIAGHSMYQTLVFGGGFNCQLANSAEQVYITHDDAYDIAERARCAGYEVTVERCIESIIDKYQPRLVMHCNPPSRRC